MKINDRRARRSLMQAYRRKRALRASLVQLIYVCAGIALGLLIPNIGLGTQVNSRDVVTLTTGAATGLVAAGSVVYALLFLVVQFAANSQSPRLNLFRDHPLVWHTLGLVLGVLVYLITCAIVASDESTTTVLVPASAIALLLLTIIVGGRLQMTAFRAVQLSPVLHTIATRTRAVIDTLYTAPFTVSTPTAPPAPGHVVGITWPSSYRVLRQIDLPGLIRIARQADTVMRLRAMPGEFLRDDEPILEIWDPSETVAPAELLACLEMGVDRTHVQDPLLGFRLLVDIAMRAMSRINDPATAVQVLDYTESLLRTLLGRDLAIGVVADESGAVRVVFDPPDWETFLAAGADEIAGADMHPMVRRRLQMMLEGLLAVAPPSRRGPIEQRLVSLDPALAILPPADMPRGPERADVP